MTIGSNVRVACKGLSAGSVSSAKPNDKVGCISIHKADGLGLLKGSQRQQVLHIWNAVDIWIGIKLFSSVDTDIFYTVRLAAYWTAAILASATCKSFESAVRPKVLWI